MTCSTVETPLSAETLCRITARARKALVPLIACAVRELAESEGFDIHEAQRMQLVAEEACLNVIEHAFGDDPEAQYTVSVGRRPGQFVVTVEDQGMPFDWRQVEVGSQAGMGLALIRAFSDQVAFTNLGRRGKRVELVKNLPERRIDAVPGPLPAREAPPSPEQAVSLELRQLRVDEGVALARCFYRSYGYSYAEDIYYPERLRELMDRGLQHSFVAVAPDGEIVGHVAMLKRHADARVAEIGQAITLPECRGQGIFERLKDRAIQYARGCGIYGLYSESATVHPYTQRANLKLGGRETGILLAFGPERLTFKRIENSLRNRQTTVLFYQRVLDEPERAVYAPPAHRDMIERIYRNSGLARTLEEVEPSAAEVGVAAGVDIVLHPDFGLAFLTVAAYGIDLVDLVRVRLQQICYDRIACIYLDLPLSQAWSCKACADLETLGFSFAGVIPEMFDGDVLRLQYLNNIPIDPKETVLASDFARDLFSYVLACREHLPGGKP